MDIHSVIARTIDEIVTGKSTPKSRIPRFR